MEVKLAFGQNGLQVKLPERAMPTIIQKPKIKIPKDQNAVINNAISSPIGSPSLISLAGVGKTVCILVCDITRPVPNHLFLRPLIEELIIGGVLHKDILIIIATGLHRPNEGTELEELIGDPWVTKNIRIQNHFARDDASHSILGETKNRGVPVALDRRFVEADIKIATGLVEPHFMAGYSGGRKVIAPGIAHHETIRSFHASRFMDSPYATSCNLEKNPLHEEQLEIISMLDGPVLAVNTVIDECRNLIFASFGDIVESHMVAVDFARIYCEISVGKKFKTVLTSSAGYPLDKTYYQTVKGMVTPLDILEDGGTLIIVSECSEGFGSKEFRKSQERLIKLGPAAFFDSIKKNQLAAIDEWQTEMQLKPMRIGQIKLFSPMLVAADHSLTGVESIDDVCDALLESFTFHNDYNVAVIPEGPYIIPFSRMI